mgnify:FL=1
MIAESVHKPIGLYNLEKSAELFGTDILKDKRVSIFCGIGDPDSFENLIISLGAKIGLSFKFPDHHNYIKTDIDKIIKDSVDKGIDTIITTEKDAARLYASRFTPHASRILVLRIELTIIKNEQEFYNRLLGLYSF